MLNSRLPFKKNKSFTGNYNIINRQQKCEISRIYFNHLSDYLSVVFNLHDCTFKRSLIRKNALTLIKPAEATIQRCSIKSTFVQSPVNHINFP